MVGIQASRRGFIAGAAAALVAAPAIVSASSLMPVKTMSGFLTLDDYSERILAPLIDRQLLTIDMITREAIQLFRSSNGFLRYVGAEPQLQVPASLAVAGGVAAVVAKNPVVSRRFWSEMKIVSPQPHVSTCGRVTT